MRLIAIGLLLVLLVAASAFATDVSLTATWTAPGDDGDVGRAASYRLAYTADTTLPWEEWIVIPDTPPPDTAGTQQSHTALLQLDNGQRYFVAIAAVDESGNWSVRSAAPLFDVPDVIPPGKILNITVNLQQAR